MRKSLAYSPLLAVLAASSAHAQIAYDAASGQTPGLQCWLSEGSTPSPVAGELDFGPSGSGEYRYFVRNDIGGLNFAQTVVVEFEAFVVSSPYNGNPCGAGQRTSVGFGVTDALGRVVFVGLADDRVFISTEGNAFAGPNNPSALLPIAGAWRTARLTITNLTATLAIDGQQVLTVARPDWPAGGTPNQSYWGGDTTSCMSGHGRVRRFSVSGFPNGGGPSQVALTTPPSNARTCPGGTLRFDAVASSPLAIAYRWQTRTGTDTWTDVNNGPTVFNATVFSGATTPNLRLNAADEFYHGKVYRLRTTTSCGISYSAPVTAAVECRSIADVTGLGATPGCDGQLTADDIIVFLGAFFSGDTAIADVARLGGAIGHDGQLTPDDIVAFLAAFFAGCQ
ncbi:MAG: GC-type dockerin domain-anchored protein [Phycisphaerales bacterium]